MVENKDYEVSIFTFSTELLPSWHQGQIKYKRYSSHRDYLRLNFMESKMYYDFGINFCYELLPRTYTALFAKSTFVDFKAITEEDFSLALMINNVPQKYLKFIVGLYKLHTKQISTSELEQLVLDNIEDLL